MTKTYEEINAKIKAQKAVVVTAEEMIDIAENRGVKAAAEKVDVVTTGTFGPMCSSSAVLNVGHTTPRMKRRVAFIGDLLRRKSFCNLWHRRDSRRNFDLAER